MYFVASHPRTTTSNSRRTELLYSTTFGPSIHDVPSNARWCQRWSSRVQLGQGQGIQRPRVLPRQLGRCSHRPLARRTRYQLVQQGLLDVVGICCCRRTTRRAASDQGGRDRGTVCQAWPSASWIFSGSGGGEGGRTAGEWVKGLGEEGNYRREQRAAGCKQVEVGYGG